jgi:integrase
MHRVLSQALALAVRWGWLAANPCERVDAPRYHPNRKEMWSSAELCAFLDGTRDHWMHAFWMVGVSSGARPGELLALTRDDLDLIAGIMKISKSVQRIGGERVTTTPKTRAGRRVITLPGEAGAALRDWRATQAAQRLWLGGDWLGGDFVFTTPSGRPLSVYMAAWVMRRECDRLGLRRLAPHGLRHLHASLLLAEGLPIPAVSQRLGHANSGITMSVYAHALGKGDEAATEAIERALRRRVGG